MTEFADLLNKSDAAFRSGDPGVALTGSGALLAAFGYGAQPQSSAIGAPETPPAGNSGNAGNVGVYKIVSPSGNAQIDGVLSGVAWRFNTFSVAYTTSGLSYGPGYGEGENNTFSAFTPAQRLVADFGRSLIADYAAVSFIAGAESNANLRYANFQADANQITHGYYPDGFPAMGDIWYSQKNGDQGTGVIGGFAYATILHEQGHALGLKHGQDIGINGGVARTVDNVVIPNYAPLPAIYDNWNYSLMTYRSYQGAATDPVQGFLGSNNPVTYMMTDIAALQFMYGANYSGFSSTNSLYQWDTAGNKYVNGSLFLPAAAGGKIFETIWDGGGTDTYDTSNFGTNQKIDLRPGNFSTIDSAKLADLDRNSPGTRFALGNVANALLANGGDLRSLIENAVTGSGNDTINGNQIANTLNGGAGNDSIVGDAGSDTLFGDIGVDTLDGGADGDSISGGAGGDIIIGGSGVNTLVGGPGDDFYYVSNATDVLIEVAGEGNDSVFASVNFTLAANVENLFSLGTAAVLTGSAGNDALIGGYATVAQTLNGAGGNDTLSGSSARDTLSGGAGDDVLLGRAGNDSMAGGDGNDSYYVEEALDEVVEAAGATAGTNDVVYASVLYTLPANVETGFTYGAAVTLNGNALANTLLGVYSGAGIVLNGLDGNDVLYGSNFNDFLFGGNNDDTFFGLLGNDVSTGGAGNDTYFLEQPGDSAVELANEGTDTIYAAFDFALSANSETLFIYGSATNAAGNSGDNTLIGSYRAGVNLNFDGGSGNDRIISSTGNDTIAGGTGNDTLTGGGGNDIFQFANLGQGIDTITDFSAGAGVGDRVNVQGIFANFAAITAAATQAGGTTTISATATDKIVLLGVTIAQLVADDFII